MKFCFYPALFFIAILFLATGGVSAEVLNATPSEVMPDFKIAGMKIIFFITVVAFLALLINRNKSRFLNVGSTNSKIEVIEERVLQGTTKVSLLSISKKQFLLTTTNTGGIAVYPLGECEESTNEKQICAESTRDPVNV